MSVTLNGHSNFQAYLRETLSPDATLRDTGKLGVVEPGDVLTYTKNGKLVKTTLGKTRYEMGRIQLNTVAAAKGFARAGVRFAGRDNEYAVNQQLWWMGYGGRMGVRAGVKPSDAINDIFKNGSKYGMECATATMVILHKAMLDQIGAEDFDRAFAKLKFFRWTDQDSDYLAARQLGDLKGFAPGDHTYFKNPEFHEKHSAWQGENVIYLGNGQYFGHGIGVATADEIISTLNSLRKERATVSAYRDDFELRLNPRVLAKLDLNPNA